MYADDFEIAEQVIPIQSLLTVEGIRFIFTSFVANFTGFSVVGITFIAMMGAGVAEVAGLMGALIRKLVKVSPRPLLAFILIFVGVLSSVATDAGYLILVPLGAAAFLSVGRHPLAGMAAAFAGVGAIFGVNLLITPSDAMITEITERVDPARRWRAHHDRRQLLLLGRLEPRPRDRGRGSSRRASSSRDWARSTPHGGRV